MRSRGSGNIVNVSSSNAVKPMPLFALYSASKFSVEGFAEALRAEVAVFGIRVLVAVPGGMHMRGASERELA